MTEVIVTQDRRPTFPILGSRGATIDLQLVIDHGKQANANHYQTVQRLAERGGLSWTELHAVLNNRKWQAMDENTAINECRAIEAAYLARHRTLNPAQAAGPVLLEADVGRAIMASARLGAWMSVALDDPAVCHAMKADINEWFSAGEPFHAIYTAITQAEGPQA